jgi:hypothetical protein
MPRTIDPALRDCLERANPRVHYTVEVSAPDAAAVIRRAQDQFFTAPPLVAPNPLTTMVASPAGGLQLAATALRIADISTNTATSWDLNIEDPTRRLKALAWTMDKALDRVRLRAASFKVQRTILGAYTPSSDFLLQIYRATRTPGQVQRVNGVSVPWTNYAFAALLPAPATYKAANITWVANKATLTFDLQSYALTLDNVSRALQSDSALPGDLPIYFFVLTVAKNNGTGAFQWLEDTTVGANVVAGVGSFDKFWWTRESQRDQWIAGPAVTTERPWVQLDVDAYTGGAQQVVYLCDCGKVPAAGTTGRIVFEKAEPTGSTAAIELSTAGSGGPWTPVKNGDVLSIRQQQYHVRVTLTPASSQHTSPVVYAAGVEWRTVYDQTREVGADLQLLSRDANLPWCDAAIGEGKVGLLRIGARDYDDIASRVTATQAPAGLEIDVYLSSDHPSVGRDKWLLLDRATVSSRVPGPVSESFATLSYTRKLKRKIPLKTESINAVYSVASADPSALWLRLTGLAVGNTDYDGKNYYLRVRSSSVAAIPNGYLATIAGSTSPNQIDFASALPGVLNAGDTVEIHSGIYAIDPIVFSDADPATVWQQLLTIYGGVPIDRLGDASLGQVGRGGFPPTVIDRAPGDATTQGKLLVTRRIDDAVEVAALIDQLSFILGGVTLEIAGRIVFRQIYPLRDASGAIVVPGDSVCAIFDPRNTAALETPAGLEQRTPLLACDYGVNQASANPDQFPSKTVAYADADAIAFHGIQDVEKMGPTQVPDEIAAWCYNSNDGGQFLATQLAQQVVLACSTGRREWTWNSMDAKPWLVPGDRVVLVTDQYTDLDPTTQQSIRGWFSYTLVLTGVSNNFRHFRGYMIGLTPNVQQLAGGVGTLNPGNVPIAIPSDFAVSALQVQSQTGGDCVLLFTFTPPVNPYFDHMRYFVQSRRTGDTAWGTATVWDGSKVGGDRFPAAWNMDYQVTPVTVTSSGATLTGSPVLLQTGTNPSADITLGTTIREAMQIRIPFTFGLNTTRADFWYREFTTDPGSPVSQRLVGTLFTTVQRGDGRSEIAVPIGASGNYVLGTFVCFNALDQFGSETTVKAQGLAITAPAAPTSVTNLSVTSSTETNRVNLPGAAAAGWKIRTYKDGVQFGSDYVLLAADITATRKDLTAAALNPGTGYTFSYSLIDLQPAESAKVACTGAPISTSGGTVPTPTIAASSYNAPLQGFTITITPGAGTPAGVTWNVKHATDGGAYSDTGETTVGTSVFHEHDQLGAVHTCGMKVYGTAPGWTQSADSLPVSKSVPKLSAF